jgi:tetratricopeptide (TPR) repeat protein
MRTPKGSGETPVVDSEDAMVAHLRTLMQLQKWPEAKTVARQLATQFPQNAHYRALLALARGHEAALAKEPQRAREEWRRAITLDPKLEAARQALSSRAGRASWVERLFKR